MSCTSVDQDLQFTDDVDVFDAAEFSTGRLPANSSVQIEFKIVSAGGFSTTMDAISQLSWPDALTQVIEGVPGGGTVDFLTDLQLQALVHLDAFGYQWDSVVWSAGLYLLDDATFDPLLLPDSATPSVDLQSDGIGIDTIHYNLAIFTGVSLELSLDVFPRASATMTGVRLDTWYDNGEVGDPAASVTSEGGSSVLAVPSDDPGKLDLLTSYVAHLQSALAVVFKPTIGVGTPVGSIQIAQFEIPVDLVSYDQDRPYEPVAYTHPLPSLGTPVSENNFGDVDVDAISDLQVPLQSQGRMAISGTVHIEGGDGAFTVYPDHFQADPDTDDGVVVTFAPIAAGSDTAVLVIDSNDPLRPRIEVPLRGNGVSNEDTGLDPGHISGEVKGCGCEANSGASTPWWLGAIALIALRRRSVNRR